MAALPPSVSRGLVSFREKLQARFGARLREVVLFGSHARGTAHDESDVDVLVVVDALGETERRDVFDLAYEVDSAATEWLGLSPLPYSNPSAPPHSRRGGADARRPRTPAAS